MPPEASRIVAVGLGTSGDGHPLLDAEHLVGGEGDGETIQQVVTHLALLGVVGGDQQAAAGMAGADAFPLDPVHAAAHSSEQEVDDGVVQQVQLVDIEHATVGLGQQTGLEHRHTGAQRSSHIHGPQQAIFAEPEGNLNEGGWNHATWNGIGCHRRQSLARDGVPVVGAFGIGVATALDDLDGGQQGMEAPCQHGFPGAPAAGNHHTTEAWVHGRQQQGQLQQGVTADGRQGKLLVGPGPPPLSSGLGLGRGRDHGGGQSMRFGMHY